MAAILKDYKYEFYDQSKKRVRYDRVKAANANIAREMLDRKNVTPLSISEATTLNSLANAEFRFSRGPNVNESVAFALRQLGTMITAGMHINTVLQEISEQVDNPKVKDAFAQMRNDVEGGTTLFESMSKHPKLFDPMVLGAVQSGEQSGQLAESLNDLANDLEERIEFQGKIKSAMTMPALTMAFAVIVFIAFLLFMVPQQAAMYEDLGSELPGITQLMISLSENVFWVIGIGALIVFAISRYIKLNKDNLAFKHRVDPLIRKLPIVGDLVYQMALYQSLRAFSMTLSAGVPIVKSLDMAASAANNQPLSSHWVEAGKSLEDGTAISESMKKHPESFPRIVTSMIATGEESGKIAEMAQNLSNHYKRLIDRRMETIEKAIEPLAIVAIGLPIGFMVLALYLPQFQLGSALMSNQ